MYDSFKSTLYKKSSYDFKLTSGRYTGVAEQKSRVKRFEFVIFFLSFPLVIRFILNSVSLKKKSFKLNLCQCFRFKVMSSNLQCS